MIEAVGRRFLEFWANTTGLVALFFTTMWLLVRQIFSGRFRMRETMLQLYWVGVQSLPVIAFSLTFISLMMITEFSFHMKLVLRQDSLVPSFATVLMLRELGPVVTCLLLTSRVGAGIAAEIGSMKLTEQLDALQLLGIDLVDYLVLPRWLACVLAALLLSVVAIAVSVIGGACIATLRLDYPFHQFFNTMFLFARFDDVKCCLIKAVVFGSILPTVACHHGLRCRAGSAGVGEAATNAVVHGSLLIIAADFAVTYLLYAV